MFGQFATVVPVPIVQLIVGEGWLKSIVTPLTTIGSVLDGFWSAMAPLSHKFAGPGGSEAGNPKKFTPGVMPGVPNHPGGFEGVNGQGTPPGRDVQLLKVFAYA